MSLRPRDHAAVDAREHGERSPRTTGDDTCVDTLPRELTIGRLIMDSESEALADKPSVDPWVEIHGDRATSVRAGLHVAIGSE